MSYRPLRSQERRVAYDPRARRKHAPELLRRARKRKQRLPGAVLWLMSTLGAHGVQGCLTKLWGA